MTNTQYTPGNWQIRQVASDSPNLYIMAGASQVACCTNDLYAATFPAQEQEANARLIAAAPELLEALRNLLDGYPKDAQNWPDAVNARAAIAKATGK